MISKKTGKDIQFATMAQIVKKNSTNSGLAKRKHEESCQLSNFSSCTECSDPNFLANGHQTTEAIFPKVSSVPCPQSSNLPSNSLFPSLPNCLKKRTATSPSKHSSFPWYWLVLFLLSSPLLTEGRSTSQSSHHIGTTGRSVPPTRFQSRDYPPELRPRKTDEPLHPHRIFLQKGVSSAV